MTQGVLTYTPGRFPLTSMATLPFLMKDHVAGSRALTRLIMRGERARLSRGEVRSFLAVARGEGALAADEERWHANLLRLKEIQVSDILTPRTVVQMFQQDATAKELIEARDAEPFSRLPIFSESPDHVTGYVYQRDVLRAVARGAPSETPLPA